MPNVNKYYSETNKQEEKKYPLRLSVCSNCFLLQLLEGIEIDEIFINYHHVSSASQVNKEYLYYRSKEISIERKEQKILEVGSNDLTMFNFLKNFNMDIYGIEPAKNLFSKNARVFNDFLNIKNVDKIINDFGKFDFIFGINVFAHNPNFSEMFKACEMLLNDDGELHIEVAYAVETICKGNYDTIYHEHFVSYSLTSLRNVLNNVGFQIIDAEILNTQGGSIKVVAVKNINKKIKPTLNFINLLKKEEELGIKDLKYYENISKNISNKLKNLNDYFQKNNDNLIFIGAPARGVVTLNTLNIEWGENILVIDDTPEKQNLTFPGFNFPVKKWDRNLINSFEKAFILSWNYQDSLLKRLKKDGFSGNVYVPFPNLKKL